MTCWMTCWIANPVDGTASLAHLADVGVGDVVFSFFWGAGLVAVPPVDFGLFCGLVLGLVLG